MSTIPRKFKQLMRSISRDERGIETVEVVLIVAAVVGILALFVVPWIVSLIQDSMASTQLPSL